MSRAPAESPLRSPAAPGDRAPVRLVKAAGGSVRPRAAAGLAAGVQKQVRAEAQRRRDLEAGERAGSTGPGEAPEDPPEAPLPRIRPVVIDAGVGNLGNLERALRRLGAEPEVTSSPALAARARCLVLPGVGAFAAAREPLRGPLEEALREALAGGAFLLGICVGFQVLFEAGEEFGTTDGLGLLPGRVTRLPEGVPLPHIGWNRLHGLAEHPLLAGLGEDPYVYFVHGFAPEGVPDDLCLARATHGRDFPAVAGRGRVLGTQFHPERSGETGLRLLGNYLRMASQESGGA